ncbi:MAG: hypothetical protein M1831_005219 [Alyxoria varia]|nr:MAG: hypothetical protein M1831_005219 [Alyxoria varia]
MTVCRFFMQGNCKFGDKCKFEHPRDGAPSRAPPPNPPRHQPTNNQRFGSLEDRISSAPPRNNNFSNLSQRGGRGGGFQPRGGRGGSNQRSNRPHNQQTYGLSESTFQDDLKFDKPLWPMSCYGSSDKEVPKLLMGGFPTELSPEEVRVEHYISLAAGNAPERSAPVEQELMAMANQQMENILNDPSGAVDYVIAGEKEHPNRFDMRVESFKGHPHGLFSLENRRKGEGAFKGLAPQRREREDPRNAQFSGGHGNTGANAPAGPRSNQNQFGQRPGFGQAAQPNKPSAFGAPSQLGQPTRNTFGTGSNNGPTQSNSAFGQPQQNGFANPGFMQQQSNPSGGGAVFASQDEPMVTSPVPTSGSGFGAPNNFGQPSQSQFGKLLFGNNNPANQPSTFGNMGGSNQSRGMNGMANGGSAQDQTPPGLTGDRLDTPQLREAYGHLARTGEFKDGVMPETAPLDSWLQIE